MSGPEVSHGRGGAGNINPDKTQYVDGEVVRTGTIGSHGDGAFSTGRGGAANIGDAGSRPATRTDVDVVPEAAVRASQDTDYHTGRGGAGNAQTNTKKEEHASTHADDTAEPQYISLADKLKHKLFGRKK